ncbi:hypothetical protein Ais01nite_68850 [Asanoa ishikariensis]|uniref:Uncharacterized protein n=1 Tax=Asanoa ishikariensis TaxID=137265 RepID=A0A1H3N6R7_9ACTN|nr:hypothetical protein [Asanoa ishikariensis]GIF68850.1 hypothetical protein Ais01nite_68850 [Asanoa ishikariensis]SDY83909.1 hypothetical protein SAMN05421684_1826 [Asanoa ishikariensis]
MNRNSSVVRWTGRTVLALALAVGGLVVAPGAAFADWAYNATSATSSKGGYASAYYTGAGGYYNELTVCDLGSADGLRARVEFWYGSSGQGVNIEASGGSGSCVTRDYPLNRNTRFYMRACLRNGSVSGSLPTHCGPVTQGIVP